MSYNKYGNHKTEIDGIKFDSKKEANRYKELKLMERGGLISHLRLQPRFTLLDKFKDRNGKTHRKIEYVADFEYMDVERGHIVEDVKASKKFQTDVYKIKKKLLLSKYPNFNFQEVF